MHAVDRVLLPPTTTTTTSTATIAASNASTIAVAAAVQTATEAAAAVLMADHGSAGSSTDNRHSRLRTGSDVSKTVAAAAVVPTVLNIIQSRPELSQFYDLLVTAGGLPSANGTHTV
jgi:hypothetical protein